MKNFEVGDPVSVPHLGQRGRVAEIIYTGSQDLAGARVIWGYRIEGLDEPVPRNLCESVDSKQ